jgi:hypothetical protein
MKEHRIALVLAATILATAGVVGAQQGTQAQSQPQSQSQSSTQQGRTSTTTDSRTNSQNYGVSGEGERSDANRSMQAHHARFTQADTDRNGSLSRTEIDALKDSSLVFSTLDSDTDGSVSNAEWQRQQSATSTAASDDE